ncbi:MAG: PhoPQ-activated pathogenicity-related family protein [Acidobacteriia bacterium]|nr:PhoPQ-activated pathogenicity-related family protein [Terriglobia bacterium]
MRLLAVCVPVAAVLTAGGETALDRYVAAPDPAYRYDVAGSIPCDRCTAHVIDMKSQSWLTEAEVDRTIWQHWVTVIRPEKITSTTGFLFITGGGNSGKPPARADSILSMVARETGAVVAELRMVPNQPLRFVGDPVGKPRSEDALIAFGWDKFLRGGDEKWLARLPMTKSAVRAMDTITSFARTAQGGALNVEKFVVSGGSKRGWATWTTAAVDKRVSAIVPYVIDLLNVVPSFEHHWRVYGFWAPAIQDYQDMKIMDWSRTPRYKEMMKVVEPYEYRDRLTMPKYIVNASGDQFFLPDSSQFYFKDLKGEKYLRYIPNTDHSLRNSDAMQGLIGYLQSLLASKPRPKFSWKIEKDGNLRLKANDIPKEVKLWQASNPKARDFRLMTIGPAWKSTPVSGKNGVYIGTVPKPAEGYTAFFLELTYPGVGKFPLKFTTEVRVSPNVYPHQPFQPDLSRATNGGK